MLEVMAPRLMTGRELILRLREPIEACDDDVLLLTDRADPQFDKAALPISVVDSLRQLEGLLRHEDEHGQEASEAFIPLSCRS